jgi:Lon protease-like protein
MDAEVFTLPLMPLPNVVFFPRTLLSLHIFEPRYKAMVEDCLSGDQRFGVVLTRTRKAPNPIEEENAGPPPIYKFLGIGSVARHERQGDGNFDLKMEGQFRAMVLEEIASDKPYRLARVQVINDRYHSDRREDLEASRSRLESECRFLAERLPEVNGPMERVLATGKHPGILADLVAANFVVDLYARQCILAEFDVVRRVELTAIQIESINQRVRRTQKNA